MWEVIYTRFLGCGNILNKSSVSNIPGSYHGPSITCISHHIIIVEISYILQVLVNETFCMYLYTQPHTWTKVVEQLTFTIRCTTDLATVLCLLYEWQQTKLVIQKINQHRERRWEIMSGNYHYCKFHYNYYKQFIFTAISR